MLLTLITHRPKALGPVLRGTAAGVGGLLGDLLFLGGAGRLRLLAWRIHLPMPFLGCAAAPPQPSRHAHHPAA